MSLPEDVLDHVFSYLSRTNLLSCTRVSTAFALIAQRHLFRSISVGVCTKNTLVVVLLARNSRLARYVRYFQMRLQPRPLIFNAFYAVLATALANMTGLTSLDLYLGPCYSSVLRKAALSPDVFYPSLHRFSCSLPFDTNVVNFLSKLPNLDSISLDHLPTRGDNRLTPCIPTTVIPHLTQFAGSQHAALALAPGRPLTSIQLHDGDLTEEIIETLASTASDLVIFSAPTNFPPLPILKCIRNLMNKLQYICFTSTRNFLDVPDRTFFLEVADVLYNIPDLVCFQLCDLYWNSYKQMIPELGEERRIWTTPCDFNFPSPAEVNDSEPFFAY